jgi:hypothetical protein
MGAAAWHIRHKDAVRQALMEKPLPCEWLQILEEVRLYGRLPRELKEKLHGYIQVFLAEKRFEGCKGLRITDEIRVTVAALACVLLLGHHRRIYPKLETILVYPGPYIGRDKRKPREGTVIEGEIRAGESWVRGPVVLAWEEVAAEARGPNVGHNVVLHEFAHQLDQEDGFADGQPPEAGEDSQWQEIMDEAFADMEEGYEEEILDDYGEESAAEAFAVATEAFFERGAEMKQRYPRLYERLRRYYGLDPAAW